MRILLATGFVSDGIKFIFHSSNFVETFVLAFVHFQFLTFNSVGSNRRTCAVPVSLTPQGTAAV